RELLDVRSAQAEVADPQSLAVLADLVADLLERADPCVDRPPQDLRIRSRFLGHLADRGLTVRGERHVQELAELDRAEAIARGSADPIDLRKRRLEEIGRASGRERVEDGGGGGSGKGR